MRSSLRAFEPFYNGLSRAMPGRGSGGGGGGSGRGAILDSFAGPTSGSSHLSGIAQLDNGRLFVCSVGTGALIHELDPATGAEINSYTRPGDTRFLTKGENNTLWCTSYQTSHYRINPDDGTVLTTVSASGNNNTGGKWFSVDDPGNYYFMNAGVDTIYKSPLAGGSAVQHLVLGGGFPLTGMSWDAATGTWCAVRTTGGSSQDGLVFFDAADGSVVEDLALTEVDADNSAFIMGIDVWEDYIWLVDRSDRTIYKVR